MSHSYSQNIVHVIFSTKDRRKFIPKEFQSKLWAYVAGVCKNHAIHVEAIGGADDHIHLLIRLPATMSVAKYPSCHSNRRPCSFTHLTFDAEFVALLKKHGVKFDPNFVFG